MKISKKKLREIVIKSVEEIWYNTRSVDPVKEQIEFITEKLCKELNIK